MDMDYVERIVKDPQVRFGRPVIKGTRISVADILGHLGAGDEFADVLDAFPQLTREDLNACFAYAADREALTRIA